MKDQVAHPKSESFRGSSEKSSGVSKWNGIKKLVKPFGKKDNKRTFLAIAIDYLIIVSSTLVINQLIIGEVSLLDFLGAGFLLILISSRYRALECLVHEASHFNLFEKKQAHRYYQFLYAFPVFRSVDDYRVWHAIHHKYGFDHPEDPDVKQAKRWGIYNMTTQAELIFKMVIRPLSGYFTVDYLIFSFYPFLKRMASLKEKKALLFWVMVISLVSVFGIWKLFLIGFIFPFFLITPIIRFLAESNEHVGHTIDVKNSNRNARNNIGVIQRIFLHPHGDGFHQIHHLFPGIPFYNLRKVYALLKDMNIDFVESNSIPETIRQMEYPNEQDRNQ